MPARKRQHESHQRTGEGTQPGSGGAHPDGLDPHLSVAISFGFGVDKVIGAINRSRWGTSARADLSVRLMAIAFIVTGIGALAAATLQHRRILRRLLYDDFTYHQHTSLGIATAVALMAIGSLCLFILIWGAMR